MSGRKSSYEYDSELNYEKDNYDSNDYDMKSSNEVDSIIESDSELSEVIIIRILIKIYFIIYLKNDIN